MYSPLSSLNIRKSICLLNLFSELASNIKEINLNLWLSIFVKYRMVKIFTNLTNNFMALSESFIKNLFLLYSTSKWRTQRSKLICNNHNIYLLQIVVYRGALDVLYKIVLFDTLVINMILARVWVCDNHTQVRIIFITSIENYFMKLTFLSMLVLWSVCKSGTLRSVCHKLCFYIRGTTAAIQENFISSTLQKLVHLTY